MVSVIAHPYLDLSEPEDRLLLSWYRLLMDLTLTRMNRRKADFKFAYKFLEDDL